MRKFIVFGAALNGIKIKRWIENNRVGKVLFFADNNSEKHGIIFDGVEILSASDMCKEMRDDEEIECIIAIIELNSIVELLRNENITNPTWGVSKKFLFDYDEISPLYNIDLSKPRLDYFEYHIADHCNLNCKGCGHFSNVAEKRFGNYEKYEKDIKRLKELFWGVRRIRLMGGEPLLNPELEKFIVITRNIFPDANIRIATNGLLIPTAKQDLFSAMKNTGVEFDISAYGPTKKIINKIVLKCIENDVRYCFDEGKEKFFCQDNVSGDSNMSEEFKNCLSNECHYLEDGKLAVCTSPILRYRLKDKLKTEYPYEGNFVDIYEEGIDGFTILEKINSPIENCKFCNTFNPFYFDWEGNCNKLMDMQIAEK